MNLARITFGFAVAAIFATAGCSGDVTSADADDALALDSTLKLQVLSAQGDSVPAIGEPQDVVREPEPRPADLDEPVAPVKKATPPQRTVAVTPSPSASRTPSRVAPAPAPAPAPVKPAPSKPAEPARATTTRRVSTPLRSTATIPAGTRLSLVSGSRVCVNSSDVGDRIPARTSSRVRGPIGTVIPSGARATGVITSLTGPLGEEQIAFDIRWISIGGTSYRVSTRVTDFELDRRAGAERCMPAGADISAALTEPLKIRL